MTTIMFDLDGTLLPVGLKELTDLHVRAVVAHWAPLDADRLSAQEVAGCLVEAIGAMMADTEPTRTNADVFFACLLRRTGRTRAEYGPATADYYREVFPTLRRHFEDRLPGRGRELVLAALERGHRVALATNPIWPRPGIEERMRWAGIEDLPFAVVPSMDDSHACKPHAAYFHELCARLGTPPSECVMVGNDVEEDGAAAALGIPVYLVTDYLEDRAGRGVDPARSGTLAETIERMRAGEIGG